MSDNFGSSTESKREKWIDWLGVFNDTGKDETKAETMWKDGGASRDVPKKEHPKSGDLLDLTGQSQG